jgi:GDPmannose 4,6-dehydratase
LLAAGFFSTTNRKIARAVAHIKYGLQDKLYMGNLSAARDWGYAPEYVEAMWLMLQQDSPEDYVIGTGEIHTVQNFLELSFAHAGLDWREHVEIDPRYFRPTEVDALRADPAKARQQLKWHHRTGFEELVRLMVDAELADLARRSSGVLERVTNAG